MPVSKMSKLEPYWRSECGRATVYVGDCRNVLSQLETEQFHAVVTDPPYGLEFMGREWDAPWKNEGKIETCDEDTDVSHPFRNGTQRVNYGNNRTRKVDAKERRVDEMDDPVKAKYLRHNVEYVRDSHLYQDWFQSCATAIMRVARPGAHLLSFGGTRMWHRMAVAIEDAGWDIRDTMMWVYREGFPKSADISKHIDKMHGVERQRNAGGSSTRKNDGSIIGLGHTGNVIDNQPITEDAKIWNGWGSALKPSHEPIIVARRPMSGSLAKNSLEYGCGGMNIDACRVGNTGGTASIGEPNHLNQVYGDGMGGLGIVDSGKGRWPANVVHDGSEEQLCSYFYTAKAGDSDRPHGKEGTTHPTVKPQDLCKYLVRLVCPRGGTVLDPFMGSGSTGVAALTEGMKFVGVEQSQEYADIAVGRLKLALQSAPSPAELKTRSKPEKYTPPPPKKLQLD